MSAPALARDRAALLVIDVQEGFGRAVPRFGEITRAAATLARAAGEMGVPVLATEQYPKGLGSTTPAVAEALPEGTPTLEKLEFAASRAEGFDLGGRDQVIVCGIEAHVCVAQTALDLLAAGVEVHVPQDAVASRTDLNREIGLRRIERAGGVVTSVETAVFELLGRAGGEEFKVVQRLILEYAPNEPAEATP